MSSEPRDKVMANHGFNRIIPGNSYNCWVTVVNTLPPVPDYYATLGLDDPEKTAPEDVIAAYKALSEKDINRAYKKLSINTTLTRTLAMKKKPARSSDSSSGPKTI
jgi:hypothetical protein